MNKKRSWFLALSAVLLGLILFVPSWGARLRSLIDPDVEVQSDSSLLASDNAALKAQLAALGVQLPALAPNEVRAMVYSEYPMNFKDEVVVNAGSESGVTTGDVVFFDRVLYGIVEKTSPNSALVETVFDPRFKMPVRIGTAGYDGLFTGGPYPKVISIAKTAKLAARDVVYTAGAGVPYATPIAEISDVTMASSDLFQEASLSFAYDENAVQTVIIRKP